MDDLLIVSRRQGVGQLEHDRQRFLGAQPSTLVEPREQGFTLQELHDQTHATVGQVGDVVDVHDARVTQPAERLGLVDEPVDQLGVVAVLGAQHLDGHLASEAGVDVFPDVDLGHATRTQARADEIRANLLVGKGHPSRGCHETTRKGQRESVFSSATPAGNHGGRSQRGRPDAPDRLSDGRSMRHRGRRPGTP